MALRSSLSSSAAPDDADRRGKDDDDDDDNTVDVDVDVVVAEAKYRHGDQRRVARMNLILPQSIRYRQIAGIVAHIIETAQVNLLKDRHASWS